MLSSFLRRRCCVAGAASFSFPTTNVLLVQSSHLPIPENQQYQSVRSYQHSGRSRRGLYDGKDIRSGNNVPFSMKKTRRKWKPNVFLKNLYSETFDTTFRFHVTAAALRSIDKAGGLDHYILKNDFSEGEGFRMKKKLLKRRKNVAYFERRGLQHVSVQQAAAAAEAADSAESASAST